MNDFLPAARKSYRLKVNDLSDEQVHISSLIPSELRQNFSVFAESGLAFSALSRTIAHFECSADTLVTQLVLTQSHSLARNSRSGLMSASAICTNPLARESANRRIHTAPLQAPA